MISPRPALALLAALLAAVPAQACGACGCTLNGDWASQGIATRPGFRLDFRYDAFTQDQLRSGTGTVDPAALPLPNAQEVQRSTANRNLTLTLDWSPSAAWGLSLQAPAYGRDHETVAAGDVANSGATLVYLSPGLTADLGRGVQAYAFVQVPVHQRVNGLQLEPRSSVSVGLHVAF